MNPKETATLKILYPPNGSVPVDKLDSVNFVRSMIKSLISLSEGGEFQTASVKPSARRISDPILSEEFTRQIVTLRNAVDGNGLHMAWADIARELGSIMTPDSVRDRYNRAQCKPMDVKAQPNIAEPIEAVEVEPCTVPEFIPVPKKPTPPAKKQSGLSPVDQTIWDMHKKGAMNHEICLTLKRSPHYKNMSTGQVAAKIRELERNA